MKKERLARFFVAGLVLGLILSISVVAWYRSRSSSVPEIVIRGRMPENGGWIPGDLKVKVGEQLHLRLTSDDVVHGFAIGNDTAGEWPVVDVNPGVFTETTLTFAQPGKYTFYCTRWCGANHWRMRGTIEVLPGEATEEVSPTVVPSRVSPPPLFVELGLDIDAPHHTHRLPEARPSATRGASLQAALPDHYRRVDFYRRHSPVQAWEMLRDDPSIVDFSDQQIWDLVAWIWQSHTTPAKVVQGAQLYAENCAACHGEQGAGDGVMAEAVRAEFPPLPGHPHSGPSDFTDPGFMLSASPALQQGKIIRGGMGTGMPYWGPIFTPEQVWALVDYLWTFPFDYEEPDEQK